MRTSLSLTAIVTRTMIALIMFFSFALPVMAQEEGPPIEAAGETAKFISPRLNVDIPDLKLSNIMIKGADLEVNYIGEYISAVYRYLIGISTTIAIVMVMIGGLQYVMASGGTDTSKAKKRIKDASIGLILLLGVYAILYVVNPQLVLFGPLLLERVEEIPTEIFEDPGDVGEGAVAGAALCKSKKACEKWCANNPDPDKWPASNEKTINPNQTKRIPHSNGIINKRGTRATDEMIAALQKAGNIAKSIDEDYDIVINSGFRPLKTQIKIVCNKYKSGNPDEIAKVGSIVAYPGGSNHGSGAAVDLYLAEDNSPITTVSSKKQKQSKYKEPAKILAEIMAKAGFVRYSKEIWHFELKNKASKSCRCSGASCPFPPKC